MFSFTNFMQSASVNVLDCPSPFSMIPRNHIKCRAPFHIEYVLFRFTENKMQTGDTHHVQKRGWCCGHSFIKSLNLIGSRGMKPTFLKWWAAEAFPLPTVVILSPGVLAHTHTLRVHNGCDFLHVCGLLVDWIGVSGTMRASAAAVTTLFLFFCLHHPTYGQVSESKVSTSECAYVPLQKCVYWIKLSLLTVCKRQNGYQPTSLFGIMQKVLTQQTLNQISFAGSCRECFPGRFWASQKTCKMPKKDGS